MEVRALLGCARTRAWSAACRSSDTDKERGQAYVGGCRITHFYGSTAAQHARMSADGVRPTFAFIFYTAAYFAIEQRALRNTSGWAVPEAYLDEEASLGGKESKLLQLLRLEHPYASVAVFTDDIQSDKLRRVLPAAKSAAGDTERIAHVTGWMEARELSVYAAADATVTVSTHDAGWVRSRLQGSTAGPGPLLVLPLPFIAAPPPPRRVPKFGGRAGMLYIGVAHTSAAQSMRWFLSEVHPLLLRKLRAAAAHPHGAAAHGSPQPSGGSSGGGSGSGSNASAAAAAHAAAQAQAQARLMIVGWGWKDLARRGPGCSAMSAARGRSTRCVGSDVAGGSSGGDGGGGDSSMMLIMAVGGGIIFFILLIVGYVVVREF